MRMCSKHWSLCCDAVDELGLWSCVTPDLDELRQRLSYVTPRRFMYREEFDPLVALHQHFSSIIYTDGGEYMMAENPNGDNDGHYCPLCEVSKSGVDPEIEVAMFVGKLATWARSQRLIPPLH